MKIHLKHNIWFRLFLASVNCIFLCEQNNEQLRSSTFNSLIMDKIFGTIVNIPNEKSMFNVCFLKVSENSCIIISCDCYKMWPAIKCDLLCTATSGKGLYISVQQSWYVDCAYIRKTFLGTPYYNYLEKYDVHIPLTGFHYKNRSRGVKLWCGKVKGGGGAWVALHMLQINWLLDSITLPRFDVKCIHMYDVCTLEFRAQT